MLKFIAHRGLLFGPNKDIENNPSTIDAALYKYEAEIDLWIIDDAFYLGHDNPTYKVDEDWIIHRKNKLWVHCKNIEALCYLNLKNSDLNYFWHQDDTLTLTSKGIIWAYPGKQPIKNSIAVLPELYNDKLDSCIGICTDYTVKYFEAML